MLLTVAKNCLGLPYTRPIVSIMQFGIAYKTKMVLQFARLTCVRFVTHNEFDFTRLEKIDFRTTWTINEE